jgi:hypothetical protein
MFFKQLVKCRFAGMSKRRMTYVVREANTLDEIFVSTQSLSNRSPNLGDLQ